MDSEPGQHPAHADRAGHAAGGGDSGLHALERLAAEQAGAVGCRAVAQVEAGGESVFARPCSELLLKNAKSW